MGTGHTSLPSQNRTKLSSIVWFGVLGKTTPQISKLDLSASSSPPGILGVSQLPATTKVSPPLSLASGNVPKDSWGFSTSGDHEVLESLDYMCHLGLHIKCFLGVQIGAPGSSAMDFLAFAKLLLSLE
ncbi:hypothetical protein HHK36_007810 [Tetracentron sinense]|uniref:Uncharacterized protein n=1 Tax=Tetracentron sinense TaxID=13715 RepID=A0A835DJB9_TETSI|nr:hypothetical protein HHK36_007810 [Tetracentron sinense]